MSKKWNQFCPLESQNKNKLKRSSLKKRALSLMMACMMLSPSMSANLSLAAPTIANELTKMSSSVDKVAEESYVLSLKQLGSGNSIYLAGQDGRGYVNFNVRSDEVISQATLNIKYTYSPDLLSEESYIMVYLNGEALTTIKTSKENGNKELEATIEIPPLLFSENNTFTFQLVGHYALTCEDVNSSKLWANINGASTVKITSLPLLLPNDLENFPKPFATKNDSRGLTLPMVFMGSPNKTVLEAAGILSSWFGKNSNPSSVAQFPVTINSIPQSGKAIIFTDGSSKVPGISLPDIAGPSIFITDNPTDPFGKLLFVMGRNSDELKQASLALVFGQQNLSGQAAALTPVGQLQKRKPYDSPSWLSDKGPQKFSEVNLNETSEFGADLSSVRDVQLNAQIPPALYDTTGKGIPLILDYSIPRPTTESKTSVAFFYDTQFVKTIALPKQIGWLSNFETGNEFLDRNLGLVKNDNALLSKKFSLHIPMESIYPNASSASNPNHLPPRIRTELIQQARGIRGECIDNQINSDNVSLIDPGPNSTIDISGMQHFIAMPNLAAFSRSGFPFSIFADLSETAVVLPDNANTYDYSAYLAALGHIGKLTGYPAASISVISESQLDSAKNKDLLVITSGSDNQSLLKKWESYIQTSSGSIFRTVNSLSDIKNWFSSSSGFDIYKNNFIAGFKSPLQSDRNVVLISSVSPENLTQLVASLDGSMGPIFGSTMRLNDGQIESVSNNQTYHAGSLPWSSYLAWMLSEYLIIFILLSSIAVAILSILISVGLKTRRRKRLK